jgi:hypothetical protein
LEKALNTKHVSLRTQYSLRQALPVATFGIPLLVLEQLLSRAISPDQVEIGPSFLAPFAVSAMPLLGLCTMWLAYDRFDEEFELPLCRYYISWPRAAFMLVTVAVLASLVGSGGMPTNEYQWAQLGIVAAGTLFGLLLFKWIYFDWLDRIAGSHQPPPSSPGSMAGARLPISPTLTGRL